MDECKPLGGGGGGGVVMGETGEGRFKVSQHTPCLPIRLDERGAMGREFAKLRIKMQTGRIVYGCTKTGRGLHSSTFQLNLSRF